MIQKNKKSLHDINPEGTTINGLYAVLNAAPLRADENYDEINLKEKLQNTIGECILILSGALHSGEVDRDIMKLVLAKLTLARVAMKELGLEGAEKLPKTQKDEIMTSSIRNGTLQITSKTMSQSDL